MTGGGASDAGQGDGGSAGDRVRTPSWSVALAAAALIAGAAAGCRSSTAPAEPLPLPPQAIELQRLSERSPAAGALARKAEMQLAGGQVAQAAELELDWLRSGAALAFLILLLATAARGLQRLETRPLRATATK